MSPPHSVIQRPHAPLRCSVRTVICTRNSQLAQAIIAIPTCGCRLRSSSTSPETISGGGAGRGCIGSAEKETFDDAAVSKPEVPSVVPSGGDSITDLAAASEDRPKGPIVEAGEVVGESRPRVEDGRGL